MVDSNARARRMDPLDRALTFDERATRPPRLSEAMRVLRGYIERVGCAPTLRMATDHSALVALVPSAAYGNAATLRHDELGVNILWLHAWARDHAHEIDGPNGTGCRAPSLAEWQSVFAWLIILPTTTLRPIGEPPSRARHRPRTDAWYRIYPETHYRIIFGVEVPTRRRGAGRPSRRAIDMVGTKVVGHLSAVTAGRVKEAPARPVTPAVLEQLLVEFFTSVPPLTTLVTRSEQERVALLFRMRGRPHSTDPFAAFSEREMAVHVSTMVKVAIEAASRLGLEHQTVESMRAAFADLVAAQPHRFSMSTQVHGADRRNVRNANRWIRVDVVSLLHTQPRYMTGFDWESARQEFRDFTAWARVRQAEGRDADPSLFLESAADIAASLRNPAPRRVPAPEPESAPVQPVQRVAAGPVDYEPDFDDLPDTRRLADPEAELPPLRSPSR